MRLTYRAALPADHNFIASTWSTCWSPPREVSLLTLGAWRTAVWSSVPTILARPDLRVLVAADADSPTGDADLFGWVAWKPHAVELVTATTYVRRITYRLADDGALPLVFCAFVKSAARRSGVARGLFRAAAIDPRAPFAYVCRTSVVDDLDSAGKIPRAVWCPHLGRSPHERNRHGEPRSAEDAA